MDKGPSVSSSKGSNNLTTWPYTLEFFTPGTLRLLMDLLMDPFEDVRANATNILKLALADDFEMGLKEGAAGLVDAQDVKALQSLTDFICLGKKMSETTGRADYADGVARSHELLYSLLDSPKRRIDLIESVVEDIELKVALAESNLSLAVLEGPIHGAFASLK